jgi:GcrA cell cycle regulator
MVLRLRELWGQPGWTKALIAKDIGVSKQAVTGKSYRLNFPRWDGVERPAHERVRARVGGGVRVTARVGESLDEAIARVQELPRKEPFSGSKYGPQVKTVAAPKPEPVLVVSKPKPEPKTVPLSKTHTCEFPMWGDEPGAAARSGFLYCGKPAVVGKPFCPEHERLAHLHY